ncbi:MAG: type 1 glutamine amidotransferase [Desulfomonile tiedjei]|nr:type 1 glutamine amidotransferase [Desulfomonile tiedjei]
MKILVIMHVGSEGPGTLGTFFDSIGAEIYTARLYAGDKLPDGPDDVDAIVSMGGPMNVYEEEKYPFLRAETHFLKQAIDAGKPVLGICLGAQMIAKALGAQVTKSPVKEVGWGKIALSDAGREDALFRGLPGTLDVLQWHEDMFHIPEGGKLLAYSEDCPHQALRYRNAYGLQFHLEVTAEILLEWFSDSPDRDDIIGRYKKLEPDLLEQAEMLYKNLQGLIISK